MKLTFYGIAFAALIVGAIALPTNMEASKDATSIGIAPDNTKAAELHKENNETFEGLLTVMEEIPKIKEIPKDEQSTKAEVKFPQDTEDVTTTKDKEMEMMPRNLESLDKQDGGEDIKTENTQESVQKAENANGQEDKFKMLAKTLASPHNTEEHLEMPLTDSSASEIPSDDLHKHHESWKEFEDKFSLLEDRLPDLTDEHKEEINMEDSIPLNFLKSFDISKEQISRYGEVKREEDESKYDTVKMPTKPETTPVYITIPIIINSHSTLPISLKLGGQAMPLDMFNMLPSSGPHALTPPRPTKAYTQTPPRETNRHRSNLRTKIYARNNNHEILAYDV